MKNYSFSERHTSDMTQLQAEHEGGTHAMPGTNARLCTIEISIKLSCCPSCDRQIDPLTISCGCS